MDATYALYAGSDPLFYDKPYRGTTTVTDHFVPSDELTGTKWEHRNDEVWSHWDPRDVVLPEQGWKIHVSATRATAATVLEFVSHYCSVNTLPFKFLKNRRILDATLAKDGDRRLAGKFITIYPTSLFDLERYLTELDLALTGMPGPYVLTDLRWRQGPVFVRYGAFRRQLVSHDGIDVLAIRDQLTGCLVPDIREAAFHVPRWIQLPGFLQSEIDQLEMAPPVGFPIVHCAVHFSNAGGVYEATLDGRPVILKEARPHVGWTPDGRDASQRLHDETALLRTLKMDVPVPNVIRTFEEHGHSFVAMERIEAVPLSVAVASRNPLTRSTASAEERRTFRDWASSVALSLRRAVSAMHDRGWVHGDLHPGNVLVREDQTVVLIDLEMAHPVGQPPAMLVGAPGFVAADGRGGVEQDMYALACIELFMYVPLIPLLSLDEGKPLELIREAAAQFELNQSWIDRQRTSLSCGNMPAAHVTDSASGRDVMRDLARTLLAEATPARKDRLWPGDPAQFNQQPTNLAHGALGILMVLHSAGIAIPPDLFAWAEHAESESAEGFLVRPGLLDGVAGTVWAYRRIGMQESADRQLARLTRMHFEKLGPDLYGGLPGIGLTLLEEADANAAFLDVAVAIAGQLQELWHRTDPPSRVATGAGGLMHGATGTALFALRLFESTGDQLYLRIATDAIDFDIHSLRAAQDGSLQVDEGWRLLPYLAHGSAGIGVVLAQILIHMPENGYYLEILDGITRAATARFTAQSGLFEGRAGFIQFLLTLKRIGLQTNGTSGALQRHIAALNLHSLRRGNQLHFAGNGLLRASCDLATGSAGVLATLVDYSSEESELTERFVGLPFLMPHYAELTPLVADGKEKEVR